MRFLDRDSVIVSAVIALMTGIGVVAGICGLLGVDLANFGFWTVAGWICGISGIIWGLLLLYNLK